MELQSLQALKVMMAEYFQSFHPDRLNGQKVAFCTSTGPAEILWAMGFKVFFPENHGAVIGAKKIGSRYIAAAAREGFSQDICSYTTCDVGSWALGESPLREAYGVMPPVPDVLVYNNQQCLEVQYWFEALGRKLNRPVLGIHTPHLLGEVTEATLDYQVSQLREVARRLEGIAGAPMDPERFSDTIRQSADAAARWARVLKLSRSHPSPWTFFDHVIHMFPVVVLRGLHESSEYFEGLELELAMRVQAEAGTSSKEIFRVYWDGMPMWFALRALSERMARHGMAVVASTYCNTWAFEGLDPADPFRSLALAETQLFINRDDEVKRRVMKEFMRDYDADGFILHNSKTCWRNSNGCYGMKTQLEQETGLPGLLVEGDISDERLWSKEQTFTKLEAFSEMMGARRKALPV